MWKDIGAKKKEKYEFFAPREILYLVGIYQNGKGMNKMTTWKNLKNDLALNQEDVNTIEKEKDLIRTMIQIKERAFLKENVGRMSEENAEVNEENKVKL